MNLLVQKRLQEAVDVERVQSRIKRLNSIFNNPKWNTQNGVRGDYATILAELNKL